MHKILGVWKAGGESEAATAAEYLKSITKRERREDKKLATKTAKKEAKAQKKSANVATGGQRGEQGNLV
jgi:hypothetical protein